MKHSISVKDISKYYRIGKRHQRKETLMGRMIDLVKSPLSNFKNIRGFSDDFDPGDPTVFTALDHISFEVTPGEVLGIIGHNGAGKSTLLKILSRITEPSRGEILLNGRVSALLEVGTGFHPELTGRDNIYMNGTVLGMSRAEISRKMDEIVDFSGIERHLDTPVKFYSSGMKVRLGFAVAAHLEPEILIVDEVLAVGDVEFQKKCLGKMQHVSRDDGRTILFVSHHMPSVKNLCTKCITLNHGQVQFNGAVGDAIDLYLSNGLNLGETGLIPLDFKRDFGSDAAKFTRVQLFNHLGKQHKDFYYGEPIQVSVDISLFETLENFNLAFMIGTLDGQRILFSETDNDFPGMDLFKQGIHPGDYRFNLAINAQLLPGSYSVYLGFGTKKGTTLDWVERVYDFHVLNTGFVKDDAYRWEESLGFVRNRSDWSVERQG